MNNYNEAWEKSYGKGDNFIFYPKEEIVKFMSRFVRKRTGLDKFKDILDFSQKVRGLDYGCGIGRQAIFMEEFGLEAYGVDISTEAIEMAKQMAKFSGFPQMSERFSTGNGSSIDFSDQYFDVTICEAVLDSMPFELAKKNISEISRVTKKLAFISLISGKAGIAGDAFSGEEVVQTEHEKGTVQCYYDDDKISELLKGTGFSIKSLYLMTERSKQPAYERGRYYLILQKGV
jgi:ubiquinone/menaquinone biosynthesis C-methylase UbiE